MFPALAVAEELVERGWTVSWMGRVEGIEKALVEQQGLPYYGLPAKAVVGRGLPARASALTALGWSSVRAARLVRQIGAQVVLGTGGYVSVPGVLGAVLGRRPTVLLEPNSTAGSANRSLSRWARSAAVADPSVASTLRCPIHETGVPIRSEFCTKSQPAPDTGPIRLLVVGGSQGARQLNSLVPPSVVDLVGRFPDLQITHQVGADLVAETSAEYEAQDLAGIDLQIVPFIDDMADAMARSHLVISRAGAITLAEVCAAARAAVLLPLSLAGAHQAENAKRLAETGGAIVFDSAQATPSRLAEILNELLGDRLRLAEMGSKLSTLARPRAAADVADLLAAAVGAM